MRTKIIVFDFDGTLSSNTSRNCWNSVWAKYNATDIDKKYYEMWKESLITTNKWHEAVIEEFRKLGVTEKILNECADSVHLIGDVEEVFKILKSNGIEIYILSGGIKKVIKRVLGDIYNMVTHIESKDIIFDENGLACKIVQGETNVDKKNIFVEKLLQEKGIKKEEILFVGNDCNDDIVSTTGVQMLCINPLDTDYANKEVWNNYELEVTSLKVVLKYL